MKCVACGAAVPDDSAFCPKCGQRVAGGAGVAKNTVTTPAERMRQAAASAGGAPTTSEERELWRGGFSPKAMVGYWIFAGLLTLAAVVACVLLPEPMTWTVAGIAVVAIWLSMIVYYFYLRLSIDYRLTTQRLIFRRGILHQVTDRTEVIDIDDVQVTQGLVERMLGVGTIKLLSSDTSDPSLLMRGIDDALNVSHLIDDARREERRRRGMYIESV
jgi:membrane protein YdbS with pleckstrin-like domain